MGRDSSIEWTHHTFNPWWGCEKVSPACANCYAETWARRTGYAIWGGQAGRRFFGEKHWDQPLAWNAAAAAAERRERVFCASMADVFEARAELDPHRARLWGLIAQTPWLDWLLLTKRAGNVCDMVPWSEAWPHNVWLGTTVETQEWAKRRLPELVAQPAAVRFLSCEPLLGPLDLVGWFRQQGSHPINWVIAGGESGPRSRPMQLAWVRNLRDQCANAEVAFHFKQWGHWHPVSASTASGETQSTLTLSEGANPVTMVAAGKKIAGRLLDGVTWDEVPVVGALATTTALPHEPQV